MEVILGIFLQNLLPVVGSLMAGVATALLNNVRKKVKVEKGVKAQEALDKVIEEVVSGLSQQVVSKIKNARRKLREDDIATVREMALNDTKAITANSVLKDVKAVVDDVDGYILSTVESKVGQQKLIEQEKNK